MKKGCVLYDHQAFEMQRFGGISNYFHEMWTFACLCFYQTIIMSEKDAASRLPLFLISGLKDR